MIFLLPLICLYFILQENWLVTNRNRYVKKILIRNIYKQYSHLAFS